MNHSIDSKARIFRLRSRDNSIGKFCHLAEKGKIELRAELRYKAMDLLKNTRIQLSEIVNRTHTRRFSIEDVTK